VGRHLFSMITWPWHLRGRPSPQCLHAGPGLGQVRGLGGLLLRCLIYVLGPAVEQPDGLAARRRRQVHVASLSSGRRDLLALGSPGRVRPASRGASRTSDAGCGDRRR